MAALTFVQLQDLFYNITVGITGFPAYNVRQAYQGQGQPAWEVTDNVVFLNLTWQESTYNKQRDITYLNSLGSGTTSIQTVTYNDVLQVEWAIYGPLSFNNSDLIRSGILSESVINTLRANSIAPLTAITAPTRAPYLFDGQWWEKSDLTASFNVLVSRAATVNVFAQANLSVTDTQGQSNDIHLPTS